jgi:Tol biopolymer transport system component
MTTDRRIREGFLMIDNDLPPVDVGAAFERVTNVVAEANARRRHWVIAGAAAAAVVASAVTVAANQGEPDSSPAPATTPSTGTIVVANQLSGLRVLRDDGSVAAHLGSGGFPAFSPDGSRVTFVSPGLIDTAENLMIASSDGSDIRTLVDCRSSGLSCGAASFAPDGATVAVPVFGARRGDQVRIITVATGESVTFRMPAGEGFDFPTWSRDGSLLLGVHVTNRGSRIATMDPSVGAASLRDLSSRLGRIDRPDWSPDGRSIAFTGGVGDAPWSDEDHPSSLYVMAADGGGEHPIASMPAGQSRIFGVDWTTDPDPFLVTVLANDKPHHIARVGEDGSISPVTLSGNRPLQGWHAVAVPGQERPPEQTIGARRVGAMARTVAPPEPLTLESAGSSVPEAK